MKNKMRGSSIALAFDATRRAPTIEIERLRKRCDDADRERRDAKRHRQAAYNDLLNHAAGPEFRAEVTRILEGADSGGGMEILETWVSDLFDEVMQRLHPEIEPCPKCAKPMTIVHSDDRSALWECRQCRMGRSIAFDDGSED